jgi:opacity protein-like surface antigen
MKSLLLAGTCAASIMLAAISNAQAADIPVEPVPEPMGLGWYVSVFGGWSMPNDLDGEIEFEDNGNNYSYDFDADLDDGFTAGIAVGAVFNEWLRGELELSGNWHDAGGDFDYNVGGYGYDVDGDVDALFVLANLWFEIPIDTFFRPYVGGGIGFGRLSVDVDANGYYADYELFDDHDWGFAYQLGAGVAFGLAENIAFDIGYRYKAINNVEFGQDFFSGVDVDDVDIDYRSHNIIAGIRIGF